MTRSAPRCAAATKPGKHPDRPRRGDRTLRRVDHRRRRRAVFRRPRFLAELRARSVRGDLRPSAGHRVRSGRHAIALADAGAEVVGVDSSPGAVEVARDRGVDARLGSATEPPEGIGRFDTFLLLGQQLPRDHAAAVSLSSAAIAGSGRRTGRMMRTGSHVLLGDGDQRGPRCTPGPAARRIPTSDPAAALDSAMLDSFGRQGTRWLLQCRILHRQPPAERGFESIIAPNDRRVHAAFGISAAVLSASIPVVPVQHYATIASLVLLAVLLTWLFYAISGSAD